MTAPISSSAHSLITLKGDEIAQPGILERIKEAVVFNNGEVCIVSGKGKTTCKITLPVGHTDEELQRYLREVYWIAHSVMGKGQYQLIPRTPGFGAGGGVSTGRPGAKSIDGDLLAVYRIYKKRDPSYDLDKLLVEMIDLMTRDSVARAWQVNDSGHIKLVHYDHSFIKDLLKAGADAKQNTPEGVPLFEAVCRSSMDDCTGIYIPGRPLGPGERRLFAALDLLEHGADFTFQIQSQSLLTYFSKKPAHKKLHDLIASKAASKGLDLNAIAREKQMAKWKLIANDVNLAGVTVLDQEIQGNQKDHIPLILEAGADVQKGYPLHAFCLSDLGVDTLELLLAKQPNLNKTNKEGKSVLELACRRPEIFERLIKAGADLNDPTLAKKVLCTSIEHETDPFILPYLKDRVSLGDGLYAATDHLKVCFFRNAIAAGISVDHVTPENPETCLQRFCRINTDWLNPKKEAVLDMLIEFKADQSKVQEETFQKLHWDVRIKLKQALKIDPFCKEIRKKSVLEVMAKIDMVLLEPLKKAGKLEELQQIIYSKIELTDYYDKRLAQKYNFLPTDAITQAIEEALRQQLAAAPESLFDKEVVGKAIENAFIEMRSADEAKVVAENTERENKKKAEAKKYDQEKLLADLEADLEQEKNKRIALEEELKQARAIASLAYSDARKAEEDYKRSLVPFAYSGF